MAALTKAATLSVRLTALEKGSLDADARMKGIPSGTAAAAYIVTRILIAARAGGDNHWPATHMRFDLNMKIDLKPFKHWIALGALLVVTLCFDSTREAHTLCWRWLLHLDGHTTVQGVQDRYGFHFIPCVQFTPKYQLLLQQQATNSLEGYILADDTEFNFQQQPPRMETAWTNSPLFPAMVFRLAQRSPATNSYALSPASMNSVWTMIQMARLNDPENGAYSQAEACYDFAIHDNKSAIQALWTSSSNRNWSIYLGSTFAGYTELFERVGLSKLDASIQAMRMGPYDGTYTDSRNQRFLDDLMIRSVQDGKPEEFARLFQLLVALRRADWLDKSPVINNAFRRFNPSGRLVEAMAKPLNIILATNWTGPPYEKYKLIRQQVFQAYLGRYADPVAMAVFNFQSESYEVEQRLKAQIVENANPMAIVLVIGTQVAGGASLLLVSLLCSAGLFTCLRWRQGTLIRAGNRWWRDPALWLLTLVTLLSCTEMLANLFHIIALAGIDRFPNPDPHWVILILLVAISLLLAFRLIKWPRAKTQMKSWKTFQFFAWAYLISIIAMAFFRTQIVAFYFAVYL